MLCFLFQSYRFRLICKIGIVFIVCLAYSFWVNGINTDIFFPITYSTGGDDIGIFSIWQNILDSGWTNLNPRLGAPFSAVWNDYPMVFTMNFDALIIKIILFFSPNPFIAGNIYFVFLPAFIGVIAFLVLLSFQFSDWISGCGAVLFAFSHFYFYRNMAHFGLTTYQFVPLAFLLCVWGYKQKIFTTLKISEVLKNKKNLIALVMCLLIANNGNGYWAPFSCFFVLVTGILTFLDTKNVKSLLPCLTSVFLISMFFLISISPSVFYSIKYGKNQSIQRNLVDPEIYGLKMTQMLIPYDIPGDSDIESRFKRYHNTAPLSNENQKSYLGIIGIIGFLLLLLNLVRNNYSDKLLMLFARLNIAGVLLGTIGGMGMIITLFAGTKIFLRGYNRISIFLLFLSISTVCYYLTRYEVSIASWSWRKYLFQGCVILFFMLTLLGENDLQVGSFNRKAINLRKSFVESEYLSDQRFISNIENVLPSNAMIYQLPYHKFPEGGIVNKMGAYSLFKGVLHSKKLRWSFGNMRGRHGDLWHEGISKLPWQERLKVLSLVGFKGIYIDRRAFVNDDLINVEEELFRYLNSKPVISDNQKLVFFSMDNFNNNYLKRFTPEEINEKRKLLLNASFGISGAYYIEKNPNGSWQWLDKRVVLKTINLGSGYEKIVKLKIATGNSPTANLIVKVNDSKYDFKINNKCSVIEIPLHVQHGVNIIEFTTNANRVHAPKDTRNMYIRLIDCSLDNLLPAISF